MRGSSPTPMAFSSPGEPSIRWADLSRSELEIQSVISLLRTRDCTWRDDPLLCIDRIDDAVISEESPDGPNGNPLNDVLLLSSTELTIRRKPCTVFDGAETSSLDIIGQMPALTLRTLLSWRFRTRKAIVSELNVQQHGVMGIAERTSNGKIDSARRRLHSANS